MNITVISDRYDKCPDCRTPMPKTITNNALIKVAQCPKCFEVWEFKY